KLLTEIRAQTGVKFPADDVSAPLPA
ncbi:gfo/Idh/MocA family oxidoreductase, partial [Salmonella enterica subsp. enterica serovar Bovismorbificans]|nr:gfo/Idh/MocA family oxidoreductase [Salmonella enterica subsp. enterica serovar Bovismorbificans]